MPNPEAPHLTELTWTEAADWFRRDPRLMVPVGTCLQHGPHLPLNTDTVIVEAIAAGIAARHRVLVGPTVPFGAVSAPEQEYAGTASLRPKTLHRVLNELVAAWEGHGVREFILLTAHGYGPHVSAMIMVMSERARIRGVDLNAVDLSGLLQEPPGHGGEFETSLLLHLAPHLVRREAMRDAPLGEKDLRDLLAGSEPVPPPGSEGVVGSPTLASAEKGRAIYEYLVEHIGQRLFGGAPEERGGRDAGTEGSEGRAEERADAL